MGGDRDVSDGRQEAFAKLHPGWRGRQRCIRQRNEVNVLWVFPLDNVRRCHDEVFVLVLEADTRAYFQSVTEDNGDRSTGHRPLQRFQNVLVLVGLSWGLLANHYSANPSLIYTRQQSLDFLKQAICLVKQTLPCAFDLVSPLSGFYQSIRSAKTLFHFILRAFCLWGRLLRH